MNTTEYYISKGFDRKTAEYFASGRKKIVYLKVEGKYLLRLTFDNGEEKIYDCSNLPEEGTVFEVLIDDSIFNRAYVDEDGNLAWDIDPAVDSRKNWNNKIDISADTCYLDGVIPA